MFQRCVTIAILILLVLQVAEARKKKDKAGKITDGVYEDATFGFQVAIPENWEPKVHKAATLYRLALSEKTVLEEKKKVNPEWIEQMGGTQWSISPAPPMIELWVVPTTHPPKDVLDTLLSDRSKSEWRKRLLRITRHPEETMEFRSVKDGSFRKTKSGPLKGTRWTGAFLYYAPSLEGLETELNVSLVCQSLDQETVLVLVMRTDKEWLNLTLAASNKMLASLKIKSDKE